MTADFAGFSFTEKVGVDAFGERWTAATPDGRRAQARRVAPALAALRTFATTLVTSGERLAEVLHPNVVATLAVGREPDGTLVVVGENVDAPQLLDRVIKEARLSGKKMPPALALHVVRQVGRGLARAHKAGVVHGGVHPRSVVMDAAGEVRLTDFAVARALAAAAAEDDSLLRGLLGYVAPGLALGDVPDARTDVFSLGALLTELCTSSPPPGLVDGPPALSAVIERALHTDGAERYPDATEMLLAIEAAATQVGGSAGPKDLLAFLGAVRGGVDRHLDDATEDLLADLVGELEFGERTRDQTPLPPPMPLGGDRASDRFPARRSGNNNALRPSTPPPLSASGAVAALVQEFAAAEEDVSVRQRLPLLPSAESGVRPAAPRPRQDTELDASVPSGPVAGSPTPTPTPIPSRSADVPLRVATADVIGEAVDDTQAARAPARAASVPGIATIRPRAASPGAPSRNTPPTSFATPPAVLPPLPELSLRSGGGSKTLWLVAVLAVAGVGLVVWKSGILRPGERAAEGRAAEARVMAERRAAEAGRPRYADVIVDAEEGEAAVWMRLGRTPLDSLPLSTASIYELRVEQEGYKSVDHVITPGRWTGSGDAMGAAVKVSLEPAPVGYTAPAAPAQEPPREATARAGRGRIHVESEPSGAEVWLLVGFTPAVRVTNLPTDRAHDFKVLLDGHAPGFARIEANDFVDPTGVPRAEVSRRVTLRPRPKDPAARPPK